MTETFFVIYKLANCPGCEFYDRHMKPAIEPKLRKLGIRIRTNVVLGPEETKKLEKRDGVTIAQFPSFVFFRNNQPVAQFVSKGSKFTLKDLTAWVDEFVGA